MTQEAIILARLALEAIALATQQYAILQRLAGKSEAEIQSMLADAIAGAMLRDPANLKVVG